MICRARASLSFRGGRVGASEQHVGETTDAEHCPRRLPHTPPHAIVHPSHPNSAAEPHRAPPSMRHTRRHNTARALLTAAFTAAFTATAMSACARPPRYALPIPPLDAKPATLFALQAVDMVVGTGAPLAAGQCVYAHYTGWLTNGTKFDSSRDTTNAGKPKEPISFPQGFRRVIAGWDLGFEGMRVGGARRLIIPYQLGYGEKGRPPVIPATATLIFDVELMQVADTLPRPATAPRGAGTSPPCPVWSTLSKP